MADRERILNEAAQIIQEFWEYGVPPAEFASRLRLIGRNKDKMAMKKAKDMTDREVIDAIQDGSPLAKTRALLYHGVARIEQAEAQAKGGSLTPIERRRMELEIAQEIMSLFVAIS